MDQPQRLSTGCEVLDELLGGGIEHGVITNVYGGAGSGKTNVCLQTVASALRQQEGTVIFVDTEGGFSSERFLQLHGEEDALDRVVLYEPTSFQEQQEVFDGLEEAVADHDPVLVVVDSLVALYRLQLNGGDAQETNTELSKQFSVLSTIARDHDLPVLVTNQIYSEFDASGTELVGRDIPAYWSKTLLELETLGDSKRKARIEKHRSRPEGIETEFYITEEALTAEEPDRDGMRVF
ncbi:MAG: DNA repair and recombination protein RadB [Candidatus Nanohaloarchaea archaeon]|nr:DNA repair and recombination protein RadB [Candidatus Nanohaloarchaea archaeon]